MVHPRRAWDRTSAAPRFQGACLPRRWKTNGGVSAFQLSIRQISAIRGQILRVLCAKPSLHARPKNAESATEFLRICQIVQSAVK